MVVQDLTDTEYFRLLKRVRFLKRKYGKLLDHLDAEDILHEILLRYLEGKSKNQILQHAVLDIIRNDNGRPSEKCYEKKQNFIKTFSFDEDFFIDKRKKHLDDDTRVYIDYCMDKFQREEKIIINLIVEWGFNEAEIARIFSVDMSRISQRVKKIQARLLKDFSKEDIQLWKTK